MGIRHETIQETTAGSGRLTAVEFEFNLLSEPLEM